MTSPSDRTSKTKVLFVNTPTLPPIGADTWIHTEIIRRLDRSAFEVHVACAPGPSAAPTPMYAAVADVPDTHLIAVDFGREQVNASGVRRYLERLGDLRLVPSLVKLAVYVRRHRIPIIHTVSRPRDAFACVVLAKATRTKCLIHMQLAYGEWMSRLLRWALGHADGLIAISEFVASTLVDSGHRPDRIHLVYNAVVFEDWKPVEDKAQLRRELGLPESSPVVVNVSRLYPEKGTALLLQAIAIVRRSLPDVRLLVVGRDVTGGEFQAQLDAIVAEEDLHDIVSFVGQRADVVRYMGAADVFAMPSFEEPFGIVYAEAMAMELPVIGLDNGGTREVVENGTSGLLSEPADVEALAQNLVEVLSNTALRQRLGAAGRERVEQRFTVDHLTDEMEAIYEKVAR
jgi:glycosyltransferase involved in cell wall biosynthesis